MGSRKLGRKEREGLIILCGTLLLLWIVYLFHDLLYEDYNEANTLAIHTVLEFFSVFVCFTISLYGWIAYRETKTTTLLWLPIVFTTVGSFGLLHTLTFQGMPFFLMESSISRSAWFWILSRVAESVGITLLLLLNERKSKANRSWWMICIPLGFVVAVSTYVFQYEARLPVLVVDGLGPTPLKNAIEYGICLLHLAAVCAALHRYRRTKDVSMLELALAFIFLSISCLLLTIYAYIHDLTFLIGHVFKVIGYLYILKGYYFTTIRITFDHTKKTKQDLLQTKSLLESFFQHTPDSIAIFDKKGSILHVNPGFERIYGWNADEVTGNRYQDYMSEMKDEIEDMIRKAAQGETLNAYETTGRRKDGEPILIHKTISPVLNDTGHITTIAAITRDVSAQKLAERRARAAERELVNTVRRQQGIIFKYKKINGAFIHTLCDGELLYDLGGRPELVVGKEVPHILSECVASHMLPFYERAWLGEEVTFEMPIVQRSCFFTLKPIEHKGKITEVIGSVIDISELRKTEALLQKSGKLAVVGELAAGVAHEIRNPLTTIKGFTQLLSARLDPQQNLYIDLMLSELNRIEAITNEFMMVAKPQIIKPLPLNMKQLLEQVILFMEPQALLHNIHMELSYRSKDTSVHGDVNQIKQVFINVIKNAVEAMQHGGTLTVTAETDTDGKGLSIRLQDTGCGIPKELIPKLGEPFYTLKGKGTGLGLMVSFRIIEAHGGSMSFSSEINVGTTVTIRFPFPA